MLNIKQLLLTIKKQSQVIEQVKKKISRWKLLSIITFQLIFQVHLQLFILNLSRRIILPCSLNCLNQLQNPSTTIIRATTLPSHHKTHRKSKNPQPVPSSPLCKINKILSHSPPTTTTRVHACPIQSSAREPRAFPRHHQGYSLGQCVVCNSRVARFPRSPPSGNWPEGRASGGDNSSAAAALPLWRTFAFHQRDPETQTYYRRDYYVI